VRGRRKKIGEIVGDERRSGCILMTGPGIDAGSGNNDWIVTGNSGDMGEFLTKLP
jgi:hypothetical protein